MKKSVRRYQQRVANARRVRILLRRVGSARPLGTEDLAVTLPSSHERAGLVGS
jgi:hypothetical protein